VVVISLKEIDDQIKDYYESDSDNILRDFYIKVISNSVYYRRVTGPFSSTILAGAAKGISNFIKNDGEMELICWATLSEKDVNAIEMGEKKPQKVIEDFSLNNLTLEKIEDKLIQDHIKALSWMVANGNLEIKIAVKKDENGNYLPSSKETLGEFHPKSGLLRDREGNEICFSGSGNESISGWKYNIESLHTFKSWEEGVKSHFKSEKNTLEKFWKNRTNKVEIFDFPKAIKEKLINYSPKSKEEIIERDLERRALKRMKKQEKKKEKEEFDSDSLEPWKPQKRAVDNIADEDYKGIVKMATGTGKTLTILFALKKFFKEYGRFGNNVLILVPEKEIGRQWVESIKKFSKSGDLIYRYDSSISSTDRKRVKRIWREGCGSSKNLFQVLTIQSLDNFDFYGKDIDFLIADEVHSYGTENYMRKIKDNLGSVPHRIGLSATPERYYDKEGTKRIKKYFGPIIVNYGIKEAQAEEKNEGNESVLADYYYYPYVVSLTSDEEEKVLSLSKKVGRNLAINADSEITEDVDEMPQDAQRLLQKRAEVLKRSKNKLQALEDILRENDDSLNRCIVYCQDHNQLEEVKKVFERMGITSYGTYTSKVYDRDQILDLFESKANRYILSIHCLDQGVDIPECHSAIFLASSGNPREYVQRRGRILRNYEGKPIVKIFDIFAFPSDSNDIYRGMIKTRLLRAWEFIRCSGSPEAKNKFDTIRRKFGIEEKELKETIKEWP